MATQRSTKGEAPNNASDADRQDRILRDDELDAVSGGMFDLGNIVGSIAKAVLPTALD